MAGIRFTNPLTRMKVKQQLFLLFLILVSPVFLLNGYANVKAEQILKRHVTNAYAELNKQNFILINRDIDTINRIMTTIIQNPVTQSLQTGNDDITDRVKKYETAETAGDVSARRQRRRSRRLLLVRSRSGRRV